jgi:hypothetical protein
MKSLALGIVRTGGALRGAALGIEAEILFANGGFADGGGFYVC